MRKYQAPLDQALYAEINNQTDRGTAIMGASPVEYHLARAIIVRLKELSNSDIDKLFDYPGALSALSSKIEIGYALNLIGEETRTDLHAFEKLETNLHTN
jgi:hypothetical protein